MPSQFRIRMKGELAGNLDGFCERVGLEGRGRLDDDWDQEFGTLGLRSREQGLVDLTLWRGFTDNDWSINLTYDKHPLPSDEAERLRQKVLDAAAAAGMTITAQSGMQSPKPTRSEG